MSFRRTVVRSLLAATALMIPALARADVVATKADSGKAVSVAEGTPFVLKLPGIRGSGFWRLDTDTTPQLILSGRITDSVKAPDAPETTTFIFKSAAPGTVAIKASYVKSGGDQTAQNSFAILVTVTAP